MYADKEIESSEKEYSRNIPRKAIPSSFSVKPVQCYIYSARSGHAGAGYQNHHLMPSSILENHIPAYCALRRRNQGGLTQLLNDEFDGDIKRLTIAQHSSPHPRYNAYAQEVLDEEGGFNDMVDEILGGRADIEDAVIGELKGRVDADVAADRSIDY